MNTHTAAVRNSGLAAGALLAVAGLTEIAVGTASWTGDKNQPTALGILTILLGAIVATAAMLALRAATVGPLVASAAAMVVPGLIAFTTAGLAAIPGALTALAAGAVTLDIARQRGRPLRTIAENWPLFLLTVLTMIYVAFGAIAGPVGLLGIAGAVTTIIALTIAQRSPTAAALVLVAGAVPFALAVWWSVVVPVTGILLIATGLPEIKRRATPLT